MNAPASFSGFPAGAFAFLGELAENNRQSWFQPRADRYEISVLEPARAFLRAMQPRLVSREPRIVVDPEGKNGRGSIFRIHRDTRFSPDKSPYKTNLGMVAWIDQGRPKQQSALYYVGLYPDYVLLHAGATGLPSELLSRFRRAVAQDPEGRRLEILVRTLARDGFRLSEPKLARVPAPHPAAHPRGSLLRGDGVSAEVRLPTSAARSPAFVDRCVEVFESVAPLLRWVAAALGTEGRGRGR